MRADVAPRLTALAARGVFYESAIAPAPLTLPSHATILSGLLPNAHGARDNRPFRVAAGTTTVADDLRARGAATIAIIGSEALSVTTGLAAGFDVYDADLPRTRGSVHLDERRADQVTDAALARARAAAKDRPLFLWAHYFDCHAPYAAPEPFQSRFAASPYDGEAAFVDEQVGRLLDELSKVRDLSSALIVITADHGEALGEHGESTHGFFLYDATIKVPLIVVDPRAAERGLVVRSQVRLVDLRRAIDGFAGGAPFTLPEDEPAFVETLYAALHCDHAQLRGVRRDGFKYLESGSEEAYDLAKDPGENEDAIARPELASKVDAARTVVADVVSRPAAPVPALDGGLPGYLGLPATGAIAAPTRKENAARPSPRAMKDAIADLEEGVRLLELGLREAAIERLDLGVARDEKNPALRFWRARALRAAALADGDAARADDAIAEFEAALELRPTAASPRDLLIHLLAQRGRYEEARALGDRAVADGSANPDTFEALGKLHLTERGRFAAKDNPLFDEALGLSELARAVELAGDAADVRIVDELVARYSARGESVQAARFRDRRARLTSGAKSANGQ